MILLSVCLSVMRCIVAIKYTIHQKCLNKWIGSALLGTWFYNFKPPTAILDPHTINPQNFNIYMSGIAMISMLLSYTVRRRTDTLHVTYYQHYFIMYCCRLAYSINVCSREAHAEYRSQSHDFVYMSFLATSFPCTMIGCLSHSGASCLVLVQL